MDNRQTLLRTWKYIAKYRLEFAVSVLLALITVISTLYVPILVGRAIDLIREDKVDFKGLISCLIRILAVSTITMAVQWIMNTVNNHMTFSIVRDMRNDAIEKIERLPLKYIDSHSQGDLVSRMIADADQFADGLLLGFTQVFTGVCTILGTLVFMLTLNVMISAVVVIVTPLSLFIAKFIAGHTYKMFGEQSRIRGEQTALIDETLTNEKLVLSFNKRDDFVKRFDVLNTDLKDASMKAIFYSSLVNPSTRFVYSLIYAGVGFFGAYYVLSGKMTVGVLVTFLSYANQYTKPFNEISGVITEFQNAIACAGRIFELLKAEEEVEDDDLAGIEDVRGSVGIENVAFSYQEDRSLIENFDLNVMPGQRVAIVGPTGCGKTTMINLLMRFYDVNEGRIMLDSNDIRQIKRHSLRQSYGMVLQDTWLRHGTIRDNIVIGKEDATDEEVINAARSAHAHSFIRRLPNGYDTVIGEDGGSLSQGQKQLLCITRIMLTLPPMLILDEATSSIDTRTELKIQNAFEKLMKGKTSFIIAHRLSTIKNADLILVMKDGRVIETGSHTELLKKGGFYSQLYNSQTSYSKR